MRPVKASAGCGACRTQSCLRGVGAKPAPTSSTNPQGRQARIYAPEHGVLGNPQHAPACVIHRAVRPVIHRAKPVIHRAKPVIHSEPRSRNPQGRQARNPRHRRCVIHAYFLQKVCKIRLFAIFRLAKHSCIWYFIWIFQCGNRSL